MIGDWFENHELRIHQLEEWKEKQEAFTINKLQEAVRVELIIKQLETTVKNQESHLDRQDVKLDKMAGYMNKLIVGVLSTALIALAKLVVDLTILRPLAR